MADRVQESGAEDVLTDGPVRRFFPDCRVAEIWSIPADEKALRSVVELAIHAEKVVP